MSLFYLCMAPTKFLGKYNEYFISLFFSTLKNLQMQKNGIRHYVAAPGEKFDFGFGPEPLGV